MIKHAYKRPTLFELLFRPGHVIDRRLAMRDATMASPNPEALRNEWESSKSVLYWRHREGVKE